jgi:glycosyltransferase involved in cell wall biosynthesis
MTGDAVGGVLTYALDLAAGLAGCGVETVLLLQGPIASGVRRRAAAVAGLRLVEGRETLDWLAEGPGGIAAAAAEVLSVSRACGVDLIHLNSPALAAVAEFRVPVVAFNHSCLGTWWAAVKGGTPPEDFTWRIALQRAGLRRADIVAAPSAAFAAAIAGHYGLSRPVEVVHNGRAAADRLLPSFGDHRFAFTAGRLWDEGKEADVLDRAASFSRTPFLAAGPRVGPHGASRSFEHLQCLGSLDEHEVRGWLRRRPVFVSAAVYEPFGLSVLEAAQAGCALVLSDIPTFRELWEGAALFVAPQDAEGFSRVVDRLADDPARRLSLGIAARRRARRYSVRAMAEQTVALYRKLSLGVREESAA